MEPDSLQPLRAKEYSVGVEKEILHLPFSKRIWDTTLAGRACKLPAPLFLPDGKLLILYFPPEQE